ncbi:MAG: alginate lyase family protein [Planctomycetes bacterium]|nr:alginate lyase family protein [Planctomycetota bacterium]
MHTRGHSLLVVVGCLAGSFVAVLPAAGQTPGLWSSAKELQALPMSGPAWQSVLDGANQPQAAPDLSNQDDNTNVWVLASAIVWARTASSPYRDKVVAAIETIVARGNPGGSTLPWARQTGAYALAADLVGYRTAAFEDFLRNMAEVFVGTDGRTVLAMFRVRPNNWGSHAFGSLAAIYSYLGDRNRLLEIRDHWVRGVEGTNPDYKWGTDLSWHIDPYNPRQINPAGAIKNGVDIDGVFPDDLRRGGSFQEPPIFTGYPWEALQGLVMAARVLERQGLPIWAYGESAILRAASCLQDRFAARYGSAWSATGDDLWMLPFFDKAYGKTWSSGRTDVWGHGKNAGWGYVLAAAAPVSDPLDSDGDGMPNAWEISYGLNPNDPSDATGDPDRDGRTNLQEYQAGTDPTVYNGKKRRTR